MGLSYDARTLTIYDLGLGELDQDQDRWHVDDKNKRGSERLWCPLYDILSIMALLKIQLMDEKRNLPKRRRLELELEMMPCIFFVWELIASGQFIDSVQPIEWSLLQAYNHSFNKIRYTSCTQRWLKSKLEGEDGDYIGDDLSTTVLHHHA